MAGGVELGLNLVSLVLEPMLMSTIFHSISHTLKPFLDQCFCSPRECVWIKLLLYARHCANVTHYYHSVVHYYTHFINGESL